MSNKTTKTKAELLEMLAEAVRNTQPRIGATQPELIRDAQPERKPKTRAVPKRTTKIKNTRAFASRKQPRR